MADGQPFAVRAERNRSRGKPARRASWLADAVEIWTIAVWVVPVQPDQAILARGRQTAVTGEGGAAAWGSVFLVAKGHAPTPVSVEDPESFPASKRDGEVAAVRRKSQGFRIIGQVAINSLNEVSRVAV